MKSAIAVVVVGAVLLSPCMAQDIEILQEQAEEYEDQIANREEELSEKQELYQEKVATTRKRIMQEYRGPIALRNAFRIAGGATVLLNLAAFSLGVLALGGSEDSSEVKNSFIFMGYTLIPAPVTVGSWWLSNRAYDSKVEERDSALSEAQTKLDDDFEPEINRLEDEIGDLKSELGSAHRQISKIRADRQERARLAPYREIGGPIIVKLSSFAEQNSADGVDWAVRFENISSKSLKYVRFRVRAYNRVGDPVRDDISGSSSKGFRITGPIGPSSTNNTVTFDNAFYGATIERPVIEFIEVIFMDDSKVTFNDQDDVNVIVNSQ